MPDDMTINSGAPRDFGGWLKSLQQNGIGKSFHPRTAAWLRVMAGTKSGAVVLVTGTQVIPYVDWLQDGMAMNSRLILHNQSKQVTQLVQPHFSTDIRVATHVQDFVTFLTDIEEHRFDIVVADVNETDPEAITTLLERMADYGLLMGIGVEYQLNHLVQICGDDYFFCSMDQPDNSVVLSKKSIQHRAVRRGGRRRNRGQYTF